MASEMRKALDAGRNEAAGDLSMVDSEQPGRLPPC